MFLLAFAIAIAAQVWVAPVYRYENYDDAWTLVWYYNYFSTGQVGNPVFGGGLDSLDVFGMLRAGLYGGFLNGVGWSRSNAVLVSLASTVVGLTVWFAALRAIGITRIVAMATLALLVVFEPTFNAATQARGEAVVLVFLGLSLLLMTRGWPFWSAFALMLGIESHPIAVTGAAYLAAYWVSRPRVPRAGLRFSLGLAAGVAYYIWLHGVPIAQLGEKLHEASTNPETYDNYLVEFFLNTRYFRHLPEAVLFLASGVLYLRNRLWRVEPFVGLAVGFVLLSTVVIPRGNFHYAVLAYPALALLAAFTAEALRLRNVLISAVIVIMLPQYGFVFWQHRSWDFEAYVARVKQAVPVDDAPIVGGSAEWFAFMNREYFEYEMLDSALAGNESTMPIDEFYFIERSLGGKVNTVPESLLGEGFQREELTEFRMDAAAVRIWHIRAACGESAH